MHESPVFGLGYLRVWEADLSRWRQFAESVLGMLVERDGDNRLLIRMDEWVGRLIVESDRGRFEDQSGSAVPAVAFGWECVSQEAWASARRAIDDFGVHTEDGDGPTAWCRDWFACIDPSGFRCEFFYGGKRDPAAQFVSPRGVKFVTGDQGMGHVLVFANAPAKSLDFYTRALGYQVREGKSADDGTLRTAFLSPSQREHCLALVATDEPSRLGHVLIEVSDLDDVGRALDRCIDGLATMTVSLGRHWNDQMLSFYLRTPAGFDVEYGFGGRRVEPERWSRGEQGGTGLSSTWGHRRIGSDGRPGLPLGR
jgi:3,4-dihydroxy-9,10-secoandrosta-1,3,5(10)-triene-9,17-dione 4,5-dioxygenase